MRKNYKELLEKDKMYIWHPYTQMKDYENDYHILIKSAKKFKLYDSENRYYYDTISSWWCNILGHNIKEINA
ncbi:MAG TPA: adenosylmethionine--8-amino-7-oxononanoate transaminase, partial [bacterium]|nr:adenosylmethionine--8-amino-7-oxononanoate transaminase [bacterium]